MNPNDGLWFMPSKNRVANIYRFFKTFKKTGGSTAGMVLLDKEDWDRNLVFYKHLEEDLPINWQFRVLPPDCQCLGDAMRFAYNTPEAERAEWIGQLCDDQLPVTKHWDSLTAEAVTGKNIVSGRDEWQDERFVGALAYSPAILKIVGGIYPAGFKHMFIDDVWETIGKETKIWTVLKDVIVHHLHHTNNRADLDLTYQKAQLQLEADKKTYFKWLLKEYPRIKREILQVVK